MKKTRKRQPEVYEIEVTNLDRAIGFKEGNVVYQYSERKRVRPKDSGIRKKLTEKGYHHVKSQDFRNGTMLFVKNAKVEVELSVAQKNGVTVYRENVTDRIYKLVGDKVVSPDSAASLANKINLHQIAVFIVDGRLNVEKC